jgi:hypothetical protein
MRMYARFCVQRKTKFGKNRGLAIWNETADRADSFGHVQNANRMLVTPARHGGPAAGKPKRMSSSLWEETAD